MRARRDLDCQTCGACCCSPDENRAVGIARWIQVHEGDALRHKARLARRLVVLDEQGEHWMRMDSDWRCAALRGTVARAVECSIYDERPTPCRTMEKGSERCLEYRRERGVDPPPGASQS